MGSANIVPQASQLPRESSRGLSKGSRRQLLSTPVPACKGSQLFRGKKVNKEQTLGLITCWLYVSTSSILPSCLDERWEGIRKVLICSPGLSTPNSWLQGTIKNLSCPRNAGGSELDSTKGSELARRPRVGITCCSSHPSGRFHKKDGLVL